MGVGVVTTISGIDSVFAVNVIPKIKLNIIYIINRNSET